MLLFQNGSKILIIPNSNMDGVSFDPDTKLKGAKT